MKKINGKDFKLMLINGGNNLYNYYPKIDSLNVFPVPDGDTGTNMNLTFKAGLKEIENLDSSHIGEVSKAFARGLLMGARGNSGVILSQIFKGISLKLEHFEEVASVDLTKAFIKGKHTAYKAVLKPVEGTILTVIRESSDNLLNDVQHSYSITEVMKTLVDYANVSLENTPELLPVLKEVGVVDSGGFGLVKIFEGMYAHLISKTIEADGISEDILSNNSEVYIDNHEGQYGYCTEYIIKLRAGHDYNENRYRNYLNKLGDSIVVVSDDDIVKIHLHTLDPGKALSKAVTYGDLINIKIENMQEQADHNEHFNQPSKEIALISVCNGDGIKKMFEELRVDYIISGGQTMNPSTEDFIDAIKQVNAKKIIILPNNSNIIMAAKQAKDVLEDIEVEVIETKSIAQGMVACINYNPDLSFQENIDEMNNSLTMVKSGEITYAIKDTNFNSVAINKDDFIGIYEKDVIIAHKNRFESLKALIDAMIDEDELITIIYGSDVSKVELDLLEEYLQNKFEIEVEFIDGKQDLYSYYVAVE